MKCLVAPREPLFDEGAKHPVLLVEAIEKSANVTLFAKHAISYVDGAFIASHDGDLRENGFPPPTRRTFREINLEGYEVKPPFCG
jgi:hypothetical protein